MNTDTRVPARPAAISGAGGLARVRRGSLAVLVLLVAEYAIGMYVNLYVTIPRSDHGHGLGNAISNGPAILSAHAVIGLLLGLGAVAVLVQAVTARHLGAIVFSVAGLLVLALASGAGVSFISGGRSSESMAMAVLTGIGLLCYAANLYLLRPASPWRRAQKSR